MPTSSLQLISLLQVSRPYKQAEFEIIFGEGISKLVCVTAYNSFCSAIAILLLPSLGADFDFRIRVVYWIVLK